MTLGELIEELKRHDRNKIVPMGFHHPHSYRGYYDQLAFEPARNITVGEMLNCAQEALNTTYPGWKGGDFTMGESTEVWLADEGDCGEIIGPELLNYMLDMPVKEA